MKKNTYNALLYKEGTRFVAQCIEIDVASFGDTQDHALEMLREAVELKMEDTPIQVSMSQPHIQQFEVTYA